MRTLLAVLLLAAPSFAAPPKMQRDVPYAEPKTERRMLDVYAPAEGKNHPVVVWIHGGGWKAGDKKAVQKKPQAFTDKGFVFVSATYRFVPDVTVKEMAGDVAKAIRWTHDYAKEFGGDPDTIFVMGHSAGAHLAALVCTDESYLKAEGLPLSVIKGCVPVDVSVYDIPKRLKDGGSVPPAAFTALFGDTEEAQRALSPVAHVAKGKHIPPVLILHVADRADTKAQSHWFADKLKGTGVPATVVAAEGKTHGTIDADLGADDDKPTEAVFAFLDGAVKKQDGRAAPPPAAAEKLELRVRFQTPITPDHELKTVVMVGEAFLEKAPHAGGGFNVVSGMLLPAAADGTYPLVLTYIEWGTDKSNTMGATKLLLTPGKPQSFGVSGGLVHAYTVALAPASAKP